MIDSLLQSIVFRLLISCVLGTVLGLGHVGIFWAECLSPLLPAAVAAVFFYSGVWKKRSLV